MRGFLMGLSVSAAFVLGCVASHFVVPPANAQSVARWDYFCFEGAYAGDVQTKAKKAGLEGWEMSGAAVPAQEESTWCFKRPLP